MLLLHQTPRSWDEFRDVLPLLGRHYRAIAMDTVGYGDSDALPEGKASIENWAMAARQLLVALGIGRAAVVGHHTGAAIAVEIAAAYPQHVAALVLSACPYVDGARRIEARQTGHVIDHAVPRIDGGHLAELRSMRQPLYPPDRVDLMERFIVDALKAGSRAAEGHRVVDRYEMESRLPLVCCPTLVIARQPRTRMLIRMLRRSPPQLPTAPSSRLKTEWCLYRIRSQKNSLTLFTASSPPNPYR